MVQLELSIFSKLQQKLGFGNTQKMLNPGWETKLENGFVTIPYFDLELGISKETCSLL